VSVGAASVTEVTGHDAREEGTSPLDPLASVRHVLADAAWAGAQADAVRIAGVVDASGLAETARLRAAVAGHWSGTTAGLHEQVRRAAAASDVVDSVMTAPALAAVSEAVRASQLARQVTEAVTGQLRDLLTDLPSTLGITAWLPPSFVETARSLWQRYAPANWPDGLDLRDAVSIVTDDGIPLVWVPRATIVTAVLEAPDRAARVQVLLARQGDLLSDCDRVLAEVSEPTLAGDVALAGQAVAALRDGHPGAAQALAAAVLESAVSAQVNGTSAVRDQVRIDDVEDIALVDLRLRVAMAPLEPFFRNFTPGKTPEHRRPPGPNRHLTVHAATPEHLSEANAVVAVLLLVSVVRALADLAALRDAEERGDD